ncbi:MAG: NAD(P)/FAD-dependent oxidoreductase [Bradymonadaceae bacterium]
MESFDLAVVGGGIAGVKGAKRASELGASVAVVERDVVGGACPFTGCMPKKFMVVAARKVRDATAPGPAGIDAELEELDWPELIEHQRSVVSGLADNYETKLREDDGIRLVRGDARLRPGPKVEVDGERIDADRVMVTTGLRPARPPIDGVEHGQTSDDFFKARTRPESTVIVGGGYIGVEFGSLLRTFGTEVTILEMRDQLIPQYGREVADQLQSQLEAQGIEVHTSTRAREIEPVGEGYRVHASNGEGDEALEAERVLMVAGRVPNTEGLGLEDVGVELDEQGHIEVDETYRTANSDVFAAGDVVGIPQLTPAAIREARTAVENALEDASETLDFSTLPSAVFTTPPVACTGLSEASARQRFERVEVARNGFGHFSASVKDLDEETFIKTVFAGEDQRLVGLQVVGPHAPDIVQGFSLAIDLGCTRADLEDASGIHPTLGEEVVAALP